MTDTVYMATSKITYVPTDADRLYIRSKFGCELKDIPSPLTLGECPTDFAGVQFAEMHNGYRFSLEFEGRPALAEAAAELLAARPNV